MNTEKIKKRIALGSGALLVGFLTLTSLFNKKNDAPSPSLPADPVAAKAFVAKIAEETNLDSPVVTMEMLPLIQRGLKHAPLVCIGQGDVTNLKPYETLDAFGAVEELAAAGVKTCFLDIPQDYQSDANNLKSDNVSFGAFVTKLDNNLDMSQQDAWRIADIILKGKNSGIETVFVGSPAGNTLVGSSKEAFESRYDGKNMAAIINGKMKERGGGALLIVDALQGSRNNDFNEMLSVPSITIGVYKDEADAKARMIAHAEKGVQVGMFFGEQKPDVIWLEQSHRVVPQNNKNKDFMSVFTP